MKNKKLKTLSINKKKTKLKALFKRMKKKRITQKLINKNYQSFK